MVRCRCSSTWSPVTGAARDDGARLGEATTAGAADFGVACECAAVANATPMTNAAPNRLPNANIALRPFTDRDLTVSVARGVAQLESMYPARDRSGSVCASATAGSLARAAASCIVAHGARQQRVEPRVHGRRAREPAARRERKRTAADCRDDAARLADDERGRGKVPRRQHELPERFESSA